MSLDWNESSAGGRDAGVGAQMYPRELGTCDISELLVVRYIDGHEEAPNSTRRIKS